MVVNRKIGVMSTTVVWKYDLDDIVLWQGDQHKIIYLDVANLNGALFPVYVLLSLVSGSQQFVKEEDIDI